MLLTEERLNQVTEKVNETVSKLNAIYKFQMATPNIYYDVKGVHAGFAKFKTWSIHFNPILAHENWESFITEIVPHEVCHIAVWHWCKYFKKSIPKPHGVKWKTMMLEVGVTPNRTHNYDVSNVRAKKIKEFQYFCTCATPIIVSSIIHNRILKGDLYRCRKCHESLANGTLKSLID